MKKIKKFFTSKKYLFVAAAINILYLYLYFVKNSISLDDELSPIVPTSPLPQLPLTDFFYAYDELFLVLFVLNALYSIIFIFISRDRRVLTRISPVVLLGVCVVLMGLI